MSEEEALIKFLICVVIIAALLAKVEIDKIKRGK